MATCDHHLQANLTGVSLSTIRAVSVSFFTGRHLMHKAALRRWRVVNVSVMMIRFCASAGDDMIGQRKKVYNLPRITFRASRCLPPRRLELGRGRQEIHSGRVSDRQLHLSANVCARIARHVAHISQSSKASLSHKQRQGHPSVRQPSRGGGNGA